MLAALAATSVFVAVCYYNSDRAEIGPATQAATQEAEVPRNGTKLVYPQSISLHVAIDQENRIYNETGVQCGWCALETLGRHHNVESLRNITKTQLGLMSEDHANFLLKRRRVNFRYQHVGNKDVSILRKYVTEMHYGAAVGLERKHMLVLCHFDEEHGIVKVIDNMGPQALKIQTWDLEKFLEIWDGCAYVVIPVNNR